MSSTKCSPRKTTQVTPVTGQATWMSHSGRSASSDVRFQAKRVNSMPADDEDERHARMPSARGCGLPPRRARHLRPDVDLEVRASRTPIMAPIMMVQMNRKRAISSVQM